MQDIVINGALISINSGLDVVRILDPIGEMNEDEAAHIVWYLYEEGFIEKDNITCEIIREVS